MAAEVSSMPVNGSYAPQQHFDQQQYAAQPYTQAAPAASSSTPAPAAANPQPEIPKDEVGWYFVEQYYTTLSRTPEKLYLYYNKRSQFVSGNETDKVHVCVGQRAINDRIKELDFQDCKVRITNVDSQASDVNIVIQVIGEISNRSQPHRKFTQTFVLAQQTNGYFVLNDIFRYMIEEEDEQVAAPADAPAAVESAKAEEEVQQAPPAAESGFQEPPPTVDDSEPKTLTSSSDKAAVEQDAQTVDKELEEKVLKEQQAKEQQAKEQPKEEAAASAVNGTAEKKEDKAPVEQPAAPAQPAPEPALEQEKPRDPEPTPVSEQPPKVTKPAAAPAPAPVKPAVPKTWASLAASANKVSMPAAPSAAAPAAAAPAQSNKPAAKSAPAPAPAVQREASPAAPAANSGDEWTAVGGSHNRQQSRQVNGQHGGQQQQNEPTHPRGYIKNVQDNIKGPEMKEKLAQFGEVNYFDIYRAKNCAFVDFKTPEGYKAAIAANPIQIGDEKFWIEERRAARGNGQQQGGNQQQQGQFGRGGNNGNYQQGGRGGRGGFRGGRGGAGGAGQRRGGAQ